MGNKVLGASAVLLVFGVPFGLACAIAFYFFNRVVNRWRGK